MTAYEEFLHGYQPEWQQARIDYLLDRFGSRFWKRRLVLELGPCNGRIGAVLASHGAHVIAVEGRRENAAFIAKHHPQVHVFHADLDVPTWTLGNYEVIINFGVFYHLARFHASHLQNCTDHADLVLLESVVHDSPDPEVYLREESGPDQGLDGWGGAPTRSFVEKILKGTDFSMVTESRLNGGRAVYDWEEKNTRQPDPDKRRFWEIDCR